MKSDLPSQTAAAVAGARALGRYLPAAARLVDDPYGLRFVAPAAAALFSSPRRPGALAVRWLGPLRRWILYMQVRTQVIDELLTEFVDGGGRQVVLLGAGYDCRAHRLAERLRGAGVYEIDHPATQRRKRKRLGAAGDAAGVRYLSWNFEDAAIGELPAALAAAGHRADQPTLTIWEGVTMYLTEEAIEGTLGAVRSWSAPGARLVFTYLDRETLGAQRSLLRHGAEALLRQVGEPWRWGWSPAGLPSWMSARGFAVRSDISVGDAGRRLLPARWSAEVLTPDRWTPLSELERVAVVER